MHEHLFLYQDFLKELVLGVLEGIMCITELFHARLAGSGGVGL